MTIRKILNPRLARFSKSRKISFALGEIWTFKQACSSYCMIPRHDLLSKRGLDITLMHGPVDFQGLVFNNLSVLTFSSDQ